MQLNDRDKRDGYVYDPVVKQYDTTFWKTLSGTPAISSNLLRFTSAAAASYIQHIFADVEFLVTVPVAPTTSQDKKFGLKNPASDNRGAAYFKINGSAFTAESVDGFGNIKSTTITWVAGWTAAAKSYRIRWENDEVRFYVNGTIVATHSNYNEVPTNALALYVYNGNADNLDVTYIEVLRAASII